MKSSFTSCTDFVVCMAVQILALQIKSFLIFTVKYFMQLNLLWSLLWSFFQLNFSKLVCWHIFCSSYLFIHLILENHFIISPRKPINSVSTITDIIPHIGSLKRKYPQHSLCNILRSDLAGISIRHWESRLKSLVKIYIYIEITWGPAG